MDDFTGSERRVMRALLRLNRFATTNEIARWAGNMSWNTAQEILERFHKDGAIIAVKKGDRVFWVVKG